MGFAKSQGAAAAMQARLDLIGKTWKSGLIMMGAGGALAAPLIYATNEAAKLEQAMKNVQQITRSSQDQMEKYGPIMSAVSHKTAVFSKAALADFALHMAQGGIRDSTAIQKLMPMWADAADILKITKHTDPNQTVEALTSMSHQFGNFEPNAKMAQLVQDFVTLMQTSPASVTQFVRGGAYINPLASRIFNIDERHLLALQATMAQTGGGGGRGGLSPAQQSNLITRSLPGIFGSGLMSGKSVFGLRLMGLTDKKEISTLKTGDKFDLMKLSDKLGAFEKLAQTAEGRMKIARDMYKDAPLMGKQEGAMKQFAQTVLSRKGDVMASEMTMKAFQYAFGAGKIAAALLGDPSFKQQLQFNIDKMANAPSLDKQQKALSGTFAFSKIQTETDFGSLMADIGMRMLPHATRMMKAIDSVIFKMDEFVLKHPKVVDSIIKVISAVSGLLIFSGLVQILRAAGMALAILFSPLRLVIMLIAATGPLAIPIAATIAIIGVGIVIWKNWGTIMKALTPLLDLASAAMGRLVAALARVVGQIGGLISAIPFAGDAGANIKKAAEGMKAFSTDLKAPSATSKQAGTKPPSASAPVVNNHYTANVTSHQSPQHDKHDCGKHMTNKVMQKMQAGSGNSVGRSRQQGGATTP